MAAGYSNPSSNTSMPKLNEMVEQFNTIMPESEEGLCMSEMASLLAGMGYHPTEDELGSLYYEMDVDGNGKIDQGEFILFASQRLSESNWREQIMDLFVQLDRDGNGYITTDEFKEMFQQIGEKFGEEEIEELIREADQDGNGQIDYKEFIHMMLNTDED